MQRDWFEGPFVLCSSRGSLFATITQLERFAFCHHLSEMTSSPSQLPEWYYTQDPTSTCRTEVMPITPRLKRAASTHQYAAFATTLEEEAGFLKWCQEGPRKDVVAALSHRIRALISRLAVLCRWIIRKRNWPVSHFVQPIVNVYAVVLDENHRTTLVDELVSQLLEVGATSAIVEVRQQCVAAFGKDFTHNVVIKHRAATGSTWLHHAVWRLDFQVVSVLLETLEWGPYELGRKREMINKKNVRGRTPLFFAVHCCPHGTQEDVVRMVRLLVSHGADPTDVPTNGFSLIMTVAHETRFPKLIPILRYELQVDASYRRPGDRMSAVHAWALSDFRCPKMLEQLMAAGCDVNAVMFRRCRAKTDKWMKLPRPVLPVRPLDVLVDAGFQWPHDVSCFIWQWRESLVVRAIHSLLRYDAVSHAKLSSTDQRCALEYYRNDYRDINNTWLHFVEGGE